MASSLKKGPFADASLLKKIECYERKAGDKSVIKDMVTCVLRFSHPLLDIQLQFTMAENMFRYMLQKIWSDTNSVSS